jgi:hypothetical protein
MIFFLLQLVLSFLLDLITVVRRSNRDKDLEILLLRQQLLLQPGARPSGHRSAVFGAVGSFGA